MAINKNHEFEELNGVKCSIIEKNVNPGRVSFLKSLLEFNKYEVIVVPSPPPKVAATPAPPKPAAAVPATGADPAPTTVEGTTVAATPASIPAIPEDSTVASNPAVAPPPETFTVGVTDYTFNPINAIFGRLLKTPDGHVVTQAYWYQKEDQSHDEVPYYEKS